MRPNPALEPTRTGMALAAQLERYASLPHATKAVSAWAALAPSRRARSGRLGVQRVGAPRERSIASVVCHRQWPPTAQAGLPQVVVQACRRLGAPTPAPPPIAGREQARVQLAASSRERMGFVVGAMHNPSLQPTAFGLG